MAKQSRLRKQAEAQTLIALQAKEELAEELEEKQPYYELARQFLGSANKYTLTDIAQAWGLHPKPFVNWFRAHGYMSNVDICIGKDKETEELKFKKSQKPLQKALNDGIFNSKNFEYKAGKQSEQYELTDTGILKMAQWYNEGKYNAYKVKVKETKRLREARENVPDIAKHFMDAA